MKNEFICRNCGDVVERKVHEILVSGELSMVEDKNTILHVEGTVKVILCDSCYHESISDVPDNIREFKEEMGDSLTDFDAKFNL